MAPNLSHSALHLVLIFTYGQTINLTIFFFWFNSLTILLTTQNKGEISHINLFWVVLEMQPYLPLQELTFIIYMGRKGRSRKNLIVWSTSICCCNILNCTLLLHSPVLLCSVLHYTTPIWDSFKTRRGSPNDNRPSTH